MPGLAEAARELGVALDQQQLDEFRLYRDELITWNQRLNLTSIREPLEIEIRHFADSLACLKAPIPEGAAVLDVGSGAGLPGLALQIARPDLRVTLLEATKKKADFLRHVVADLGLATEVLAARAEELDRREAFDVVTARALAALPALLELTLPFARLGGLVLAMKKGQGLAAEVAQASRALSLLGGELEEPVGYALDGEDRQILRVRKVRPTPPQYPRRPGVPAKHPL